MTSSLTSALGFDNQPISHEFITIEEHETADASFMLSTILYNESKNNKKLILVLCHNSIGHYQNISLKLGYNLQSLKDSGRLVVIEVFQFIVNSIAAMDKKFLDYEHALKELYLQIKGLVASEPSCIILENVSNLLLLQFSLKDVLFFTNYVRGLMHLNEKLSVVCLTHFMTHSFNSVKLCNSLKHVSNVVVEVRDLKTGRALTVSGVFSVKRNKDCLGWYKQNEYHFKLLDRSIRVFAPGLNDC